MGKTVVHVSYHTRIVMVGGPYHRVRGRLERMGFRQDAAAGLMVLELFHPSRMSLHFRESLAAELAFARFRGCQVELTGGV